MTTQWCSGVALAAPGGSPIPGSSNIITATLVYPHRCTISCTISPICIGKVQWHWICVKQHSSSFMRDSGTGMGLGRPGTPTPEAAPNPSHSPQLTQEGSWCWVLVITTLAPMLGNAAWQHGQWAAWHTKLGNSMLATEPKLGLGEGSLGCPTPQT